ncbi:hypothetical protein F0919_00695 [Taibaiella lutea]|uniref:tRNA_anti-like n=1 Tax=Taibaiella lutea TaxID=2608001 RepID=A0A5M6CMI3_9BACT|nr:hypothetical protein [Taibaiella lutea]KAA5536216.1 hypothetical protein F0919_00695 [Taibaiella lutea]
MLKKIGIVLLILIAGGVGYGIYLWNKPAPKAENQDALKVEAKSLFTAYAQNDKAADSLYLGKWLEVSGNVQSVDTNQDGQKILILETGDLMQAVMCVMRDKNATSEKGKPVIVKGKCTGMVNDVVVNDCILIEK